MKTDVKEFDCDFLAFSAHKLCGPSGVGVLYGKYDLLQKMEPVAFGGGANARFDSSCNVLLKEAPYKFEAGTPNIEGVLGLGAAIEYISSVGMENIAAHEDDYGYYNIPAVTGDITVTVTGVMKNSTISLIGSLLETFKNIFNMFKEFIESLKDLFGGFTNNG